MKAGEDARVPPLTKPCMLARAAETAHPAGMLDRDLSHTALELPPADRLELARRLVESVVAPTPLNDAVTQGIRRIEDVATGRVPGLTEEQYRAVLG